MVDLTTPSGSVQCPAENPSVEIGDDGSFIYAFNARAGAAATISLPALVKAGDRIDLHLVGAANPAAGRYRLSVATSSDPEASYSRLYAVGPASGVARPTVAVSYQATSPATMTWAIGTTVRHDLPQGASISLLAPPGAVWPSSGAQYTVTDQSSPSRSGQASSLVLGGSGELVSIGLPTTSSTGAPFGSLAAGDKLELTIVGVTAPAGANQSLQVATSADPVWVASAPLTVKKSPAAVGAAPHGAVLRAGVALSSTSERADGVTESIAFTVGPGGDLAAGKGTITVIGPPGTIFGSCSYGCSGSVLGNNATYTLTDLTTPSSSGPTSPEQLSVDSDAVTVAVPKTLKAGDRVVLTTTQSTNPASGDEHFLVFTSSEPTAVAVPVRLSPPAMVRSPTLVRSSKAAGANGVTYTASFTTTGQLLAGLGTITLSGPPGTIFGSCPYGCGDGNPYITITDLRHPAASTQVGGDILGAGSSIMSFLVPKSVASGARVSVTVTQVTNPPASRAAFSVDTSSAPEPATVAEVTAPAAAVRSPSMRVVAPPPGQTVPTVAGASPGTDFADLAVTFHTSAQGALVANAGAVTLITPGLDLAAAPQVYFTDHTQPASSGSLNAPYPVGGGSVSSYRLPFGVGPGDSVTIEASGVAVPPGTKVGAELPVQVVTSSDLSPVPAASGPSSVSSISQSLTPPSLALKPTAVLINAGITLGLVLFIVFPAALFNETFSENYADIVAWWRRWSLVFFPERARRGGWALAGWAGRLVGRPGRRQLVAAAGGGAEVAEKPAGEHEKLRFVGVVAIGALLGAMLDPDFGANTRTLTSFVGIALSSLAGILVSGLVTTGYHRARRHGPVHYKLHALPLGLLVAAACVLISRGIGFLPGYLYGVVAGVKFSRDLAKQEEGHLVALGSSATMVLALAAWLGWDALNSVASKPGAFVGSVIADDFLSALFVGGLVGTVISLLPLRFLPGHKLQLWHKGAWALTFGTALFLLVDAVLRPDSNLVGRSHAPLVTVAALFVVFGGGSLLFRQHFARKHKGEEGEESEDGQAELVAEERRVAAGVEE